MCAPPCAATSAPRPSVWSRCPIAVLTVRCSAVTRRRTDPALPDPRSLGAFRSGGSRLPLMPSRCWPPSPPSSTQPGGWLVQADAAAGGGWVVGALRRDLGLERQPNALFALKLCLYAHVPLTLDAGHGFGLGVVDGVCPCSMDGCTAFLVRPTCRSVQSVRNSRGPEAPLLHRATARVLFRLGELAAARASSVVFCRLASVTLSAQPSDKNQYSLCWRNSLTCWPDPPACLRARLLQLH